MSITGKGAAASILLLAIFMSGCKSSSEVNSNSPNQTANANTAKTTAKAVS